MSLFRQDPVVSFKFRTFFIQKIFTEPIGHTKSVDQIVQSYYDGNGAYRNENVNTMDPTAFIDALNSVATNTSVPHQVTAIAQGIVGSILTDANKTAYFTAARAGNAAVDEGGHTPGEDDKTQQYSNLAIATVPLGTSYALPPKFVSYIRNIDPYSLDDKTRIKLTKEARDGMAMQGAEYLQYLFRLTGKFFHNEDTTKIMFRTGMKNDLMGMYRVVLYADLRDDRFKTIRKQIDQTYKIAGFKPFHRDIAVHLQVPFYYLVVVYRPSNESRATHLYIRFMEDLTNEYQMHIMPLMKQKTNTSEYPYNPNSVPSDFWTLKYIDKGLNDLSAKIAIRSYADVIPALDDDQRRSLWRRDSKEPAFEFKEIAAEIGKEFDGILEANLPEYRSNKSATLSKSPDLSIRQAFTMSEVASCNMMTPGQCELPLPLWIRDVFDSTAHPNNLSLPIPYTKHVVLYFLMLYNKQMRASLPTDANAIFSKEIGKDFFPNDKYLAAIVYNMVIAQCLRKYRKNVSWTEESMESDDHPSPWAVLVEKSNDINGPRYAFPNYTGLRDMVQSLDVMLFSFIGGYISAQGDMELANTWRKIRVALLRMTYLNSESEFQEFHKAANLPGFVERVEEFKHALQAIADNDAKRAEIMSTGATLLDRYDPAVYKQSTGSVEPTIRKMQESELVETLLLYNKDQKKIIQALFTRFYTLGKKFTVTASPPGDNAQRVNAVLTSLQGTPLAYPGPANNFHQAYATNGNNIHVVQDLVTVLERVNTLKLIRLDRAFAAADIPDYIIPPRFWAALVLTLGTSSLLNTPTEDTDASLEDFFTYHDAGSNDHPSTAISNHMMIGTAAKLKAAVLNMIEVDGIPVMVTMAMARAIHTWELNFQTFGGVAPGAGGWGEYGGAGNVNVLHASIAADFRGALSLSSNVFLNQQGKNQRSIGVYVLIMFLVLSRYMNNADAEHLGTMFYRDCCTAPAADATDAAQNLGRVCKTIVNVLKDAEAGVCPTVSEAWAWFRPTYASLFQDATTRLGGGAAHPRHYLLLHASGLFGP